MSRVRAVVRGVVFLFAAGVTPLAVAAAQRTFVAHYGVDNPGCSIALPCRGFAAAVAATSANGEVIVLDSAGYGAVTITKSVSIIAPPGVYAGVSVTSGTGIAVNAAPADKVVLRGLTVNGQGGGDGIAFVQGAELNIEGCEITNMGADGIVVSAANGNVTIRNTTSRDNAANGISILGGSARVVLDNVQLTNNGGSGLYAMNSATAMISGSSVAGNAVGLQGDGPAISITTIVASHNKVSRNGIGIKTGAIMGLVYVFADNNLLSANNTAVSIGSNSTGITFGNNVYAGNGADGSLSLTLSPK